MEEPLYFAQAKKDYAALFSGLEALASTVRSGFAAHEEEMHLVRRKLAELSDGQERILAELEELAHQNNLHKEAIKETKTDLALARAKWLGWRGLAVAIGVGILEAIKSWM